MNLLEDQKDELNDSVPGNISKILAKKESGYDMRKKGRLVLHKKRRKMTPAEIKAKNLKRAKEMLGEERVQALRDEWQNLKTGNGQPDQLKGDGIIAGLLKLDLSYDLIQSILSCGKGRICRVNDPEAYEIKHSKDRAGKKLTTNDKENMVAFFEELDKQAGFACAHRLQRYYLTEEGIKWSTLWKRYEKKQLERKPPSRVVSYKRWLQFRKALYPRLSLSRNQQDLCNTCEKIRIQLKDPSLSEEDKKELEAELADHLEPAQDQRRA